MRLSDYVANIPLHQKEGRSYSHVSHDDLRRWLKEIEEAREKSSAFVESLEGWEEAVFADAFIADWVKEEALKWTERERSEVEGCSLWKELTGP